MTDDLTLVDLGMTMVVIGLVLAVLMLIEWRWPRTRPHLPTERVSPRAMRRLIQRLDAERAEHPERQS